jgi:hypothetical protein
VPRLDPSPVSVSDSDGSVLCTGCGLCCSGLLFTYVELAPAEVAWAERRRLPIAGYGPDKAPGFSLPCALLVDRKCSDYLERPHVCRRFKCKLLLAFEAREVDLAAARAIVERVRALAARVYPEGRRAIDDPSTESVQTLLDLGELEAIVSRNFREIERPTSTPP